MEVWNPFRGLINSCVSFGQKVGNGLGSAASSWILAVGGYVGTAAVQTPGALPFSAQAPSS